MSSVFSRLDKFMKTIHQQRYQTLIDYLINARKQAKFLKLISLTSLENLNPILLKLKGKIENLMF